jgi:hypothetical protein
VFAISMPLTSLDATAEKDYSMGNPCFLNRHTHHLGFLNIFADNKRHGK